MQTRMTNGIILKNKHSFITPLLDDLTEKEEVEEGKKIKCYSAVCQIM